ncbi:ABC-type phosphate/phosphonate transport system substrate-binding protein [Paraburkholderia bannensis]|uniref:ABC-type phosphate/phosphonate transport system substrate-binding protein n=1 Tax=Paraburkholderia bannensis TaxID=765414 RepID=A0A7W9TZV3_9BURK|nr:MULTISPECIES: PhnD/SsuA/transferrin family substrate-binding protein [Paraburkholderia]MBB3259462.1 ABC-type phosphate/phosphonate transport system substrate-binding protein [Paraburkholderia sp. WP4_3_2]MBB6104478.1 ABC-type phosphate/phosphonate transport system substrate-binding protein [Paraburkholderia bannensis]
MSRWIAALPMYNVTPQHDALWRALLRDTLAAFSQSGGPREVDLPAAIPDDLLTLWRRPDLLLSQTCGFPYRMLGVADSVNLLATPAFDAEGCEGGFYRSTIVVSARAWDTGAVSLAACRGLRAACNGQDSHSGMNALRHAVAPLARDGRFFSSVAWVGSHLNALRALSAGEAEVAAIDCVTLAYVRDALPERLRDIRSIGMSAAAPGLPFIASRNLPDQQAALLRDALDTACAADSQRARTLRLRGFVRLAAADYARIERYADEARALGYPELR